MGLVTDFAISERKDSPVRLGGHSLKSAAAVASRPVAREIIKELI
jgi:hypothetical protein